MLIKDNKDLEITDEEEVFTEVSPKRKTKAKRIKHKAPKVKWEKN